MAAVFRDHSRGRAVGGAALRPGDRVELEPAVYVAAIIEQTEARRVAGDTSGARNLARLAVAAATPADVPSDLRRRAFDSLGTLEHQLGNLGDAASLITHAVEDFNRPPVASPGARAAILNELGAIRIEQRDYAAAREALDSARSYADGALAVRVTNNLGALAALQGDRPTAERLYQQARALVGESADAASDREAIEKNLRALRAPR